MTLIMRDYTIMKVVQATHHKGDVTCSTCRGMQCSCMSLISVSWALLRSPGLWDQFNLDYILGRGSVI